MAGTNEFLPIAGGVGANVITQAAYESLTTFLANGFQSGIVESDQFNKVIRQSSFIAAAIAQLVANKELDALDDGDLETFVENLFSTIRTGYLCIADEKSSGTGGGSSIAGTQTRTLNTVRANTITGASLASDIITLPAGTYRTRATSPGCEVNYHKASLYNVSDSADVIIGTSENTAYTLGDVSTSESKIVGRFTITEEKTFSIRHYTEIATATTGLGYPVSDSRVEVYTLVEIVKE